MSAESAHSLLPHDEHGSPDAGAASGWQQRNRRTLPLALRVPFWVAFTIGLVGVLLAVLLRSAGLTRPTPSLTAFVVQFGRFEALPSLVVAIFALAALATTDSRGTRADGGDGASASFALDARSFVVATALLTFAACIIGCIFVFHRLLLTADEYSASFQAKIFSAGMTEAAVPQRYWGLAPALKPLYVSYHPGRHVWLSHYLPVYAAIRAVAARVGVEQWTNPALAALTVPVLWGVCMRLWPGRREVALLCVGVQVTSSQFLFMSMTGYSMPAHLLLNLVWLWFYLDGRRGATVALPWVGVLALGLHNPFPHALFVAPFLGRELRTGERRRKLYIAGVYVLGSAVWVAWLRHSRPVGDYGGLLAMFGLPSGREWLYQLMDLVLLLSWQAPLVPVLFLVAIASLKRLDTVGACLAAGVLGTLAFYVFFPASQVHGWGYRYAYAVLGNVVLLSGYASQLLAERFEWRWVAKLSVASLAVALLVQIPLRAWQIERFVRPSAAAHAYIASLPSAAVIVDPTIAWYGWDLLRNDPLLRNSPHVLGATSLTPGDSATLGKLYGPSVHRLSAAELRALGVPTWENRR